MASDSPRSVALQRRRKEFHMSTIITSEYDASPLAPRVQWPDHEHHEHAVQFYAEDAASV